MSSFGHSGDAKITDEGIAELRSRIGKKHPLAPWNTEVTHDGIRHFAEGIGDDNPLFCDRAYGAKSQYGSVIATPTFLDTFRTGGGGGATGGGLPGVFALWGEDIWELDRPVTPGTPVTGSQQMVEVLEKVSKWAGRSVHQITETTFHTPEGERLGTLRRRTIRGERAKTRESKKYESAITKYKYTNEEISNIIRDYDQQPFRGAVPRYIEDVNEGDDLGYVIKGPLTTVDMVTFLMGWGSPLCKAHKIAWDYMKKRPGVAIVDPETNVPEFPEAAHWNEDMAKRSGVYGAYDIGGQRISWFGHLMTNWVGDAGFVNRLQVQIRTPNYVADTTWIRGRVTRKYVENGQHKVDCELWGENQRGHRHSLGWASAILPTRS